MSWDGTVRSNAELAAGVRAHGEWLRETTAEVEQLLAPIEDAPITQLFRALFASGILNEKWTPAAGEVHAFFRCTECRTPRTRMKGLQPLVERFGPITGFRLRCRTCGAPNTFRVEELEATVDEPRRPARDRPRRDVATVRP